MTTAIEITTTAVRLATVEDGKIIQLVSYPVADGADPIQVLGASQLPARLGSVRVLLANEAVLVRVLIQPPCPRERLDKVVGFELRGGGDDDAPLADWTVVPGFGGGDFRILGIAVKPSVVHNLRSALAVHGASLDAVSHPSVGLYQAWRRIGGTGDVILADVGGAVTHLAIVRGDELALVRSMSVGMGTLIQQIAELRGMSIPEATKLVGQLRASSPEEIQHLVKRQASQIAVALTGAVKFAKAQLQVDDWQPTVIALAGAGAQVHGFAEAVAERAGIACRPFNAFARLSSLLVTQDMDRLSALPTPWAACIGAAATPVLIVDALADERRARSRFWATDGFLRASVAIAVVMIVAAMLCNEIAVKKASDTVDQLGGDQGLVRQAERQLADISKDQTSRLADAARLAWLDGEHRASRVASELLNVVASLQHPDNCPIALSSYRVSRQADATVVELVGWAQSGRLAANAAQHAFDEGLRSAYPSISSITQNPTRFEAQDRQNFHLVLLVPDRRP